MTSITREAYIKFFLDDSPEVSYLIARTNDPILIQARNAAAVYMNAQVIVELLKGESDDMLPGIHLQMRQQARASMEMAEQHFHKAIDLVYTMYLIETKCNCPNCKEQRRDDANVERLFAQYLKAHLS